MRLLLALGIVGGATWISLGFVPSECAPPTGATEIFCARLWTPALFGMTAGFIGVRRWAAAIATVNVRRGLLVVASGAALMTIGNLGEYWIFFGWPHQGPDGWLRGMLWMSFLLGWLGTLLGAVGSGFLLLAPRNSLRARLFGSVLVTTASLTVFVGILGVGLLAVGASTYGLVAASRTGQDVTATPA